MSYDIKQVILVRTDLNMRKGKLAAQVAHASMKVFFDRRSKSGEDLTIFVNPTMLKWVNGQFAKIVLGVESEELMLQAIELADKDSIPTALVTDAGYTEFHGIPTNTCIAIGPDFSEKIDKITGPSGLIKTKLL